MISIPACVLRPVYDDTTQLNSTRQREQQLTQFVGHYIINENTTDSAVCYATGSVELSCVAINTPLCFNNGHVLTDVKTVQ